jgi:sialate O-acetylesterase
MRVWFDHGEGLTTKRGATVEGFEVAGADRNYRPASARIDAGSVLASSLEVPEPKYVRYAWKDVPVANLYNNAGLPASPFSSEGLVPGLN